MQANFTVTSLGYQLPDGTALFENITVAFGRERTGLVGPNGVGKSTFLALLAGHCRPTQGTVATHGTFAFHRQAGPQTDSGTVGAALGVAGQLAALARAGRGEASFDELAALEGWWDLEERIQAVFAQCGIADLPTGITMERLSGGERVRVRFARLLLGAPDFLLLDEPTNHLDGPGRAFVYEMMLRWKHGLLVATHDRELLAHVTQIAEFGGKTLRFYGGNYAAYQAQKEAERAAASQAVQAARETVAKARALASQAAERQAKRSGRARNDFLEKGGMPKILAGARKRRAQETAGRLGDVHQQRVASAEAALRGARERQADEPPMHLDLSSPEAKGARCVVRCEGVNVQFPGGKMLWRETLGVSIMSGERVAVRGANGAGKTVFLKLIAGLLKPTHGRLVRQAQKPVYLDQHTAVLRPGSVLENARRYSPKRPEWELRLLLARMGLPNDAVFKDIGILSGGERVRAAFACLMVAEQAPDLLILDEPDNHLDLQAMLAITAALRSYRGALLVVSHDETFLASLDLEREIKLTPV